MPELCDTLSECNLDIGEIRGVQRQAKSLLQAGITNTETFPPYEFDRFTRGIAIMLTALKKLAIKSRDTPQRQSRLLQVYRSGRRGRPKVHVNGAFLQVALRHRGPARISKVLKGISARTIQRRALEYGMKTQSPAVYQVDGTTGVRRYQQPAIPTTQMSNEAIDELITETLEIFPAFGIRMVLGHLRTLGYRFSYKTVSAAMNRLRGVPGTFGRRRIHRRRYQVDGPNSLWHGDANLNMVFFGFVIQMFVDGYSRLVTAIQVSANNKAKTVLDLFLKGVKKRGVPSRVRGDHGTENLQVAAWMIQHRGDERGSYIFGRSVHNIRVERMWVDVTAGFGSKWKIFFQRLQGEFGLDTANNSHIWLLKFLFLPSLNRDAEEWANSWNAHTMDLPDQPASSPEELYFFGLAERGERGIQERNELLAHPEDYGIDWAELERPAVMSHFLSRNYPRSAGRNPFQPQPPSSFHHLHLEEARCPMQSANVRGMCEQLERHCDLRSRSMDERCRWWIVALEYCQNHEF